LVLLLPNLGVLTVFAFIVKRFSRVTSTHEMAETGLKELDEEKGFATHERAEERSAQGRMLRKTKRAATQISGIARS
jgi:hypothetical protein